MKIEKKKTRQIRVNPEIPGLKKMQQIAIGRTHGILEAEETAWVILALQRAISSIRNKKDVKEHLGGAYDIQHSNWSRILEKIKKVDNRL